jgi:gliding motility associated protien GldN
MCVKKISVYSFVFLLLSAVVVAQETDSDGFNPNSIRPIHETDIMYKKSVWRRMDLNEKQNRPFFAKNNEITKLIIDAVNAGELTPYFTDSTVRRMTKEDFLKNMKFPESAGGLTEEEKALGFTEDDGGWGDSGWGDEGAGDGGEAEEAVDEYFFPQDVKILEIKEDIIFDKKRSRLYYDIQAITMILPAELFETGIYRPVASFKYKDLVPLFKKYENEAKWFNPQNSREHKDFADAFDLRLFTARLTKVENPENNYIVDIYNKSQQQGIMASKWLENEIIEYEHDLWEF